MNNKKEPKRWEKPLIFILIGVIVGVTLSYAMVASGLKKAEKSIQQQADASAEQSSVSANETETTDTESIDFITTYEYEHEDVVGEELESFKSDMVERLNGIRERNSFVQLQTGAQEYESYVYNSNGECVAETSDGSYSVIFRNDDKVVKYEDASGALAVGTDIEILKFIENAVKAPGTNENAKLYKYKTDDNNEYLEYRIDLIGDEGVRLCYSPLGDKFADVMMENLKAQDEEWNPHLVLVIYVPTDTTNRNFGAVALSVYDNLNKEYTNWDMLGWIELTEWKLDDWWYTYDFSKTDTEEYVSHMQTLMEGIHERLDEATGTEQEATGVESNSDTDTTEDASTEQSSEQNEQASEASSEASNSN